MIVVLTQLQWLSRHLKLHDVQFSLLKCDKNIQIWNCSSCSIFQVGLHMPTWSESMLHDGFKDGYYERHQAHCCLKGCAAFVLRGEEGCVIFGQGL